MNPNSNRVIIIQLLILVTAIIFILRLFYLQIFDPSYKASAEGNIIRRVTAYPSRGLIFDRDSEILVCNAPIYDLMIIPHQVKKIDTLKFCTLLNISFEEFKKRYKFSKKFSPYIPSVFESRLSNSMVGSLQEYLFEFPGFYVQPRTVRDYPYKSTAHALGYIGEISKNKLKEIGGEYRMGDYIGISGLEDTYENLLKGMRGVRHVMVNVRGVEMGSFKEGKYDTVSVSGLDLTTTLKASLQKYGEKLMENKTGAIVCIEPSSGEILAFVSSPAYNPVELTGKEFSINYRKLSIDTLKPLFNRPLMAQYPPGSVFKIVNHLIALQEKLINNNTSFSCDGTYNIASLSVGCHPHPSPLNLEQSIQHSCNAYYCYVFRYIMENKKYKEVESAYSYWRKNVISLGFGNILKTDLPNEKGGFIPSPAYYNKYFGKGKWKWLTVLSLAIGQGEILCTPLQLANFAGIIANKGFYYTPHFVKRFSHSDKIKSSYRKKNYSDIDSVHFNTLINGMKLAVDAGTATLARIPDIELCGKTGTAQNPHGKDHSVFIGFAPKNNPRIAVAVMVENSGFGGTWAAPIASLMVEKYLSDTVKRAWIEEYILKADLVGGKSGKVGK